MAENRPDRTAATFPTQASAPETFSTTDIKTVSTRTSRPSEVQTHGDPSSRGLVPIVIDDSSLFLPQRQATTTPSDTPKPRRKSETFGLRYTYRKLLGQGGMGEVRLYSDRTIGREVAMKVIRDDSGASPSEARFVREARVQGQLEHPAVLPVYDIGVDAEGHMFFTMKRIRGNSLGQILQGLRDQDEELTRQFSRRRLLSAFHQVCVAMAYTHARGVLHRDLKPANVMLGDFGEVYIIDWGLAKIRGEESEASLVEQASPIVDLQGPQETVAGEILGTPGYMAPEQLAALHDELDGRADVYALGAMFFEILTLTPLHQGETLNDLLISTLGPPRMPSTALNPGDETIAPELDALCLAALAKDPDERLPSAAEFASRLQSFLDGDRDSELRKEAAIKHAIGARALFESSRSDPADEASLRGRAMREVASALAMDPENEHALGTFYRLMTELPKVMPKYVREELARTRLEAKRVALRSAAVVYLSFALFVPCAFYAGLKSWTALLAQGASIFLCFVVTLWHLRYDKDASIPPTHVAAATLTVAVSVVVFGPFILTPILVMANTTCYAIVTHSQARARWITAFGLLAIIVPVALELAGVLPSTFSIEDGNLVITSLMFHLSPGRTLLLLGVFQAPLIMGVAWYIARMKRAFDELDSQARLQAWQLRQIVPARIRSQVSD